MAQAHVNSPQRGIPSLDGWRAVSILMVLALHSLQGIGYRAASPAMNLVIYTLSNGAMGVRIFFVISGYLITRLLLKEQGASGRISLKGFYLRRAFRILPPLYLYLGLVAGLAVTGRALLSLKFPALAAAFLTIYVKAPDRDFWLLEHTWSLCVEEQFYLLWPFALVWVLSAKEAVLQQRRAIRLALGSICLIVVLRIPWSLKPFTPVHFLGNAIMQLDTILFGALAAVAEGHSRFEQIYRRATRQPWLLAVLLFVVSSTLENAFPGKYIRSIGAPIDGVLIMWLLLWTVREPQTLPGRILNARPVRWIGVLSYSLYLWQTLFLHEENQRILGLPGHLPVPIELLLVFAAACASFYLVERPSLRLRDHFFRRKSGA